ncbi:5-dehydro-4-deoxyglucarate dehydratase [Sphaerotilus montanus]|jgi:5-dehydro-4-deoxyglucarate dehydratase|uniref:Probable 5-dehydro-4-deoxyglucarate dehydratase n=1 Tax=Sphaerotilus montanus TaxID=522889 RepID=A0A7Y9QX80_9BURK|nr:5-dehydro-4-deoxyglucarate dehydratase [Sphaerotilus montanus]NYG32254.1 5-dehydro-4-deoxyglucarate dehydratase [Sphaerotilus montanus]NZD56086.1 5-dehydro-4-deoxyglucarate dehydratase [Sphaerotilus montanus]
MSPQELKTVLEAGLLSFPLTDFDAELNFDPKGYAERLEWLQPYGASALFAAGGTGEFFSLEPGEYSDVIRVALDTCRNRTPILAGAGGATRVAIQYAQEAERLGAQGVLLLPHYLTEASQDGLVAHVQAVCRSVQFGVVVYNRGACRLTPQSLLVLAETCPNLIGFKDGFGDIEKFVAIRQTLGERFAYLGGLPTAEVFAGAYKAMGCPVYSSAVFNFIPKTAMDFYNAHAAGDTATCDRLIRDFFLPYIALRNKGEGYAVSIVKAGATLVGHSAGPVRPPLSDLLPAEVDHLGQLIAKLGPQ